MLEGASGITAGASVTGEAVFDAAKRFWKYGQIVEPNREHRAIYNERYMIYRSLRGLYLKHKTLFK